MEGRGRLARRGLIEVGVKEAPQCRCCQSEDKGRRRDLEWKEDIDIVEVDG